MQRRDLHRSLHEWAGEKQKAGPLSPTLQFRHAGSARHSTVRKAQAMSSVAVAVDRLEIGNLAIGRDAEFSQRLPGGAVVSAQNGDSQTDDSGDAEGENAIDAITEAIEIGHAGSFRAG